MALTVRDVITAALTDLGVVGPGRVLTAQEAADGMFALNALFDQWGAESNILYTVTRTVSVLTPSQSSFTVGPTGNIVIPRPIFIDHIGYVDASVSPSIQYPLQLLTDDEYEAIPIKAQTSTRPQAAYYNPTFPNGTLWPWPIPTASNLFWALYVPTAGADFTAISDAMIVPPGYRRMIVKNLALELAPSYGREVSPLLVRQAAAAMAVVKRVNSRPVELKMDPALLGDGGIYNVRTDS